jgi:hypothetical protein
MVAGSRPRIEEFTRVNLQGRSVVGVTATVPNHARLLPKKGNATPARGSGVAFAWEGPLARQVPARTIGSNTKLGVRTEPKG